MLASALLHASDPRAADAEGLGDLLGPHAAIARAEHLVPRSCEYADATLGPSPAPAWDQQRTYGMTADRAAEHAPNSATKSLWTL